MIGDMQIPDPQHSIDLPLYFVMLLATFWAEIVRIAKLIGKIANARAPAVNPRINHAVVIDIRAWQQPTGLI